MHAAHDEVIALATLELDHTQIGFFPNNTVPGLRITNAHLLLCMALKGRLNSLRQRHAMGGMSDYEGAVPTLIQTLIRIKDDVAI